MEAAHAMRPTRRLVETKAYGQCIVLSSLGLVDEDPNLLVCGLVLWTEEEWAMVKLVPPHRRDAWWKRREAFLELERQERKTNPARTIYWPYTDSSYTTLATVETATA